MEKIMGGIKVHPRKRVPALSDYDYSGKPWPTELAQVYGSYSANKAAAYRDCKALFKALDGRKFRITSHNSQFFCVAFECVHPDTGEALVVYVTPFNRDAYYIG